MVVRAPPRLTARFHTVSICACLAALSPDDLSLRPLRKSKSHVSTEKKAIGPPIAYPRLIDGNSVWNTNIIVHAINNPRTKMSQPRNLAMLPPIFEGCPARLTALAEKGERTA